MERKALFQFGTREVVFAAIGAALYGVLSALTNLLIVPGSGNVTFRPAVGIVFFFGLAFGPIVGFITGFLGNIIGDLLTNAGGFWGWWHVGNGLMGLVAGLFHIFMTDYRSVRDLVYAGAAVITGAAVGMFVAGISEMWVSGIDFTTAMLANFWPAFLNNVVNGLIVTIILMVAYSAIVRRSGR
jgi:energy-coupling factor transport system substrate-specific component